MTKPYTYLIGWTARNLWYYGVRFRKNCSPEDLWTKYFTSSVHVKRAREEHGEPDVIQVRRVFSSPEDARVFEHRVLRRMKVRLDERFLNRNELPAFPSEKHPLHVEKIATKLRGKKLSPEHCKKVSDAQKGKPRAPFSEAHRARMSEARQGMTFSEEHRQNIAKAMTGQEQSAETRAKRKASLTGKKKSPEHVRAVVEAKKRRAVERSLLNS